MEPGSTGKDRTVKEGIEKGRMEQDMTERNRRELYIERDEKI